MEHFTPTLGIKDTSRNIKEYVKTYNDELWRIFKPLIPFIAVLHLFDAVISDLFFPNSKNGFVLGGLVVSYFYTCLVISWHRVVIEGPNNYTPMNPFKPKRHELVFIGMGFLIGICSFLLIGVPFIGGAVLKIYALSLVGLLMILVVIYVAYRLCFYFPAKAVNADITLGKAFDLSKGYLLNIMGASFLASLKIIGFMVLYILGAGVLVAVVMGVTGSSDFSFTAKFILGVPVNLYFQPILTVIGVTALSNFYLYAVQNPQKRAL